MAGQHGFEGSPRCILREEFEKESIYNGCRKEDTKTQKGRREQELEVIKGYIFFFQIDSKNQ